MNTRRKPTELLLWPLTFGLPIRDAFLWPMQIAQAILGFGATYCVFSVAGGDWRHPLATDRPLYAAGFAFLALGLMAWFSAYEAHTVENIVQEREARIAAAERPLRLDSPYALQVAERAVLAAAFQIDRAQLPAEHPQYHDLREAVALLANAIGRGDSVHPDTERTFRQVFGKPAFGLRRLVADLVRDHGPIQFHELATMLRDGSQDRPPMMVTSTQLTMAMRDPDNPKVPAPWLAPRERGEAYQHRDNLTAKV